MVFVISLVFLFIRVDNLKLDLVLWGEMGMLRNLGKGKNVCRLSAGSVTFSAWGLVPVKLGWRGDRKEKATSKTLEVSRNENPYLLSGNDSKEVTENMMVIREN